MSPQDAADGRSSVHSDWRRRSQDRKEDRRHRRDGVCHHELHDRREFARPARRGGIRSCFDFLLRVRGSWRSFPMALVAAELASTFPKQGGMFRWVGEAFGPRWGFAGRLLAVAGMDVVVADGADLWLVGNGLYLVAAELRLPRWPATSSIPSPCCSLSSGRRRLFTFRGMEASVKLSTLGGMFGTIIPGGILIVLAATLCRDGQPDPDAAEHRLLPGLWQCRQHGSRREHLSVLRGHGNAGGPCQEPEESVARLPAVDPAGDDPDGRHLRARHARRRCRHPAQGHRSGSEPA